MTKHRAPLFCLLLTALVMACACRSTGADQPGAPSGDATVGASEPAPATQPTAPAARSDQRPLAPEPGPSEASATFAGGCFWCMEGPFEKIDGVRAAISGYSGGEEIGSTYAEVSSGATGHTEAVRVYYDPKDVTYERLLDAFWRAMDPTDAGGQFADRGAQYRPAIFVHGPEQRAAAEASKRGLADSKRFEEPIVVPIVEAMPFYVAEQEHQDYYKTNRAHYLAYRKGSGREDFLAKVWGSKKE